MYKWMKKNQKKLLAVFGVFLMIAFVATLGYRGPSGRNRSQTVAAYIGKTPVYHSDLEDAKDQWAILMRTGVRSQSSFGQEIPLPYAALPYPVVQDIQKHPELFLLLQTEARQNGVSVTNDNAMEFWVNQLGRPADYAQPTEISAIRGFLLLAGELRNLGQAVKVSRPQWQHEVAKQYQAVRLNLVDFRADEFEKNVPAPTPKQIEEQFEKYKNTPPRQSDSQAGGDSLGFGYQIPSRVKVQYIAIPRQQVADSLLPTPEARYQWAVKAAQYYTDHQEEFRNLPPATQPKSSSQPASQPAVASTQPLVKPFDQVKRQIIDKLMADDVAKKMAGVEREIATQLAADWNAIAKSDPAATQPATAATSRPAQPPMTLARLEQLRTDLQQKQNVSIELHEINDWQDSKSLAGLPGIGAATSKDGDRFPEYALNFAGQPGAASAAQLQIWEPSQPLSDAKENVYIFRLTAAEPAHAPADLNSVLAQVTKDFKTAQAYELAKQAAQKAFDSAKSIGLAQFAQSNGVPMIATAQFAPRSGRPIPNYPLTDPAAQTKLDDAAQKLLEHATPSESRPDTLVEMPSAQRVVVAELAAAQLELPEWFAQYEVDQMQRQQAIQKLAADWFSYDAVVSRMAYKPEEKPQGT
jgi:hypothetical protein